MLLTTTEWPRNWLPRKPSDETTDPESGLGRDYETEDSSKSCPIPCPQKS